MLNSEHTHCSTPNALTAQHQAHLVLNTKHSRSTPSTLTAQRQTHSLLNTKHTQCSASNTLTAQHQTHSLLNTKHTQCSASNTLTAQHQTHSLLNTKHTHCSTPSTLTAQHRILAPLHSLSMSRKLSPYLDQWSVPCQWWSQKLFTVLQESKQQQNHFDWEENVGLKQAIPQLSAWDSRSESANE